MGFPCLASPKDRDHGILLQAGCDKGFQARALEGGIQYTANME
jgi:hypothetical protein